MLEQILWYPAKHYPSIPVRSISTGLLTPSPSGCGQLLNPALGAFFPQGKYILTPSPITYAEEQLFHFFGQLLGIAIRADVPLPLDLLPSFWKTLVGEPLDPDVDLQEADILTYNYVKKFENVGPFFLFLPFSQDSPIAHCCLPSVVAARWFLWEQGWEMCWLLLDEDFTSCCLGEVSHSPLLPARRNYGF